MDLQKKAIDKKQKNMKKSPRKWPVALQKKTYQKEETAKNKNGGPRVKMHFTIWQIQIAMCIWKFNLDLKYFLYDLEISRTHPTGILVYSTKTPK